MPVRHFRPAGRGRTISKETIDNEAQEVLENDMQNSNVDKRQHIPDLPEVLPSILKRFL